MNDSLDLDDVLESDAKPQANQPTPVVAQIPVLTEAAVSHDSRALKLLGMIAATVVSFVIGFGICAFLLRDGSDTDPDVDPVDGKYVAIFYDDQELQSYSASQREFLNSVNTANWLEEHKADWQKIDEQDDVSKLPKPFQVMAEKHRSKLPWIVIASGKKFASEPIESNDQAMKLLERVVK